MTRIAWWSFFISGLLLFPAQFIDAADIVYLRGAQFMGLFAAALFCLASAQNRNRPSYRLRRSPRQKRPYTLLYRTIGILLGIAWALYCRHLYFGPIEPPLLASSASSVSQASANLTKNGDEPKGGMVLQVKVMRVSASSLVAETLPSGGNFGRARLRVSFGGDEARLNRHLIAKGELLLIRCASLRRLEVENSFTFLEALQGIAYRCGATSIDVLEGAGAGVFSKLGAAMRQKMAASLDEMSPYAKGFLLADTSGLPEAQLRLIRKMGIAHLFSASGLHLGLLFALFVLPFRAMGLKRTGGVLGLAFCFFYLATLDFRLSLLRAFLFLAIYLGSRAMGRRLAGVDTLFLTACIMEAINPLSSFSPSFLLSFGITLIILLFFPALRNAMGLSPFYLAGPERAPQKKPKTPKTQEGQQKKRGGGSWLGGVLLYLRDHAALTLSASLGASFFSFILFGYFHVFSLLYNFLLVPFAGLYLGAALVSVWLEPARVVVGFGDALFDKAIAWHYLSWERFHPAIHELYVGVWLASLLFGCAAFLLQIFRERVWSVRKFFGVVLGALLAAFGANHFFIVYPQSGLYPFPDGAALYHEGALVLMGSQAHFLQRPPTLKLPEAPRVETLSDPRLSALASRQLLPSGLSAEEVVTERGGGLSYWNGICLLFHTRFEARQWHKESLADCKELYLVHSNKRRPPEGKMAYLFSRYGFTGRAVFVNYYRWHGEELGASDVEAGMPKVEAAK